MHRQEVGQAQLEAISMDIRHGPDRTIERAEPLDPPGAPLNKPIILSSESKMIFYPTKPSGTRINLHSRRVFA